VPSSEADAVIAAVDGTEVRGVPVRLERARG
jgi:hypothetical protein